MRIAVAWWCLEETRSATVFAMVISLSLGCEIYLSPFLSSFGDHYPRLKLIFSSQFTISIIIILVLIINFEGYFNIYMLTILLALISICVCFRDPTIVGSIADFVNKDQVADAITRRSQINSIYIFIGPVIAAFMTSYLGIGTTLLCALFFSVLSSLFYFIIICSKKFKSIKPLRPSGEKFRWFKETKSGFVAIINVRSELYIAIVAAVVNFNMYPFFSIIVPYWINQELKLPASYLGMFEGAFGLGLIAGSSYFVKVLNTHLGRFYTIAIGFMLLGISIILIVSIGYHFSVLCFAFVCGASFMLININLNLLRVSATPPAFRVRMSAIASFFSRVFNPIGVSLSGLAVAYFGVQYVVMLSGISIIMIVPFLFLSKNVRNALTLPDKNMEGYYERTYPTAFK